MSDMNEIIAGVLRLDAEATPGPWHWQTGDDELYMCATYVGTTPCLDARTMAHGRDAREVVAITLLQHPRLANVRDELWNENAALIAYYRTAAPALAREVQRLQGEVRQAQTGHDCALVAAYESAHRAGQEAMRERCASRAARDADGACSCGRPICQPDCARVRLLDLADAIRALEVSDD